MVSNLLPVWRSEAVEWRSRMATLYGHGRVLPKRTAAYLDWLVCTTSSTLVPRRNGLCNSGDGAWLGVDALFTATMANCTLLYRDALADRRNPDRELRIPQLFGSRHGGVAARRRLFDELFAKAVPEFRTGDRQTDIGAIITGNEE